MIRRILDWGGYAGLALLAAGAILPFARPEWGHYRGFLLVAGALLVLAWLLAGIEDYRRLLGRRATRYGVNAAIMIVLVLGVTALVQALSVQHTWRWDLTESKRFSLSPQTIQVLGSLKTDVGAVSFFRGDQPGKRVAEDLFKQYARYANGRFTWKSLDPDREPGLARRYAVESYGTIVLETKSKSEKVLDAEEEKLTNALVKVTREGKRVVYVVQGHGEHELGNSERAGFSEAKTALERTNYEVKPLVLAREGKIPDDASVVIVPGPRNDLFKPELDALDAYIDKRAGKVLLMVNPFQNEGLRKYLVAYGFTLGQDLVVENNPIGRLFGIGPEVPLVQQYERHPITRDLAGISTLFPMTRSIGPVSPAPKGLSFDPLARTSPQSWGETNREELQKGVAKPDPGDAKGPLTVAAVATKDKARLVVYGTSNLASNQFLNLQGNRDFFLNTVSWLAEEEDQISIRPKDARQTPVFMNSNQAQVVFLLPVVVLPGLALLGGIVAVVRRRAAK
ncbi:MAG: GldG family protein [Candidatus Rokubacteria bacterium]|nr:GldG family protein [Candidatus Rokubacteria bacterium]